METKVNACKMSINLKYTDTIYHFCIALLPFLYVFNVPVIDKSVGTVLLIIFIPHSLVYIIRGLKKEIRLSAFPFFFFYLYIIFRSDGNIAHIILCVAAFINLWGMTYGAIRNRKVRQIIEWFAVINAVLVIIQLIGYYGFHFRIEYIPQWMVHRIFRGSHIFRKLPAGLYRPSALFLEPAHYSQFCIFALISSLFPAEGTSGKTDIKKAVFIGMGAVLTTSGMGIMLAFALFFWYIISSRKSKGHIRMNDILKCLLVLSVAFVVLLQIPFFQTSLQRIFSTVNGYNAIKGRTQQWGSAIGPMHGKILWFGYGYNADYPYYLAGLADTVYEYGILGVIFWLWCLLSMMLRKIGNYVWCCCIVFILLFCVAHLTNLFVQVFYFGIIMADAIIHDGSKTVHFTFKGVSDRWKSLRLLKSKK